MNTISHQFHSRRGLSRILLPEEFRGYVESAYESSSNRYWGFRRRGKKHVLLNAGWENTRSNPYDLGEVDLNCKVFCHFGCSSALHFWRIVRTTRYKGWVRPSPPTDRYAYFTTDVSNEKDSFYWIYYVLKYPNQNNWDPWWQSLQWAKHRANRRLRLEREPFRLY